MVAVREKQPSFIELENFVCLTNTIIGKILCVGKNFRQLAEISSDCQYNYLIYLKFSISADVMVVSINRFYLFLKTC